MTNKIKKIARWITFVLRHEPAEINTKLGRKDTDYIIDKNGYVFVEDILNATGITLTDLEEIVEADGKTRFSIAIFNDRFKIRANQGHSTSLVDLDFDTLTPPDTLFHGTTTDSLSIIRLEGLKPMSRQHVHLSDNLETATQVGSRHGEVIILIIDCVNMIKDGYEFFLSDNKVWLTKKVPSKYIINFH